jgi:hypothetical protein
LFLEKKTIYFYKINSNKLFIKKHYHMGCGCKKKNTTQTTSTQSKTTQSTQTTQQTQEQVVKVAVQLREMIEKEEL